MILTRLTVFLVAASVLGTYALEAPAAQPAERPNILVIMADDVGPTNISAYSLGLMAPTPQIDRIAKEGKLFTDHYAEPTCTPGRAAFITGQYPIRTGLTTVGLPGSPIGLRKEDPTLATVLKPLGYRTGQFGKNHLGDRDEHLPTVHGFDEFFGNLYHMNSEEEPEQLDYPTDQMAKYRPRGVIHSFSSGRVVDTGPLTRKRMETIEWEFVDKTKHFMRQSVEEKKPFFVWFNSTRMHIYTHVVQKYRERAAKWSTEDDVFAAGMMELDDVVGALLAELEQLGVAKNTIVIFTSDNGPMSSWWPDGGTTPFKGEKSSSWEGAYRVPTLIRWPSKIPPGTISNGLQSHMDLFTTLAAAAGASDVNAQLRASHKVMIDGVNNLKHWTDPTGSVESARESYVYYVENSIIGVRWKHWKSVARARDGFFDAPRQAYYLFNLRMDPFERHLGHKNNELAMRKAWVGSMLREVVEAHIGSLREFPPRQPSNSLTAGFEKTK